MTYTAKRNTFGCVEMMKKQKHFLRRQGKFSEPVQQKKNHNIINSLKPSKHMHG